MTGEGLAALATGDIPNSNTGIPTAAGNGLAVGADGDATDVLGVTGEGLAASAAGDMPNFDGVVSTTADEYSIIAVCGSAVGDAIDSIAMSLQGV